MAKKPAPAVATPDQHPAMDYAQHEATYAGFITFVKWSVVALGFVALSLYAFIEAHNAIIGSLLLLVIPVGAIAVMVMGSRRS